MYPQDAVLRALTEGTSVAKEDIVRAEEELGDFLDRCIDAEILGYEMTADYYHLWADRCRLKAYSVQAIAPSPQYVGSVMAAAYRRSVRILNWISLHPYHAAKFRDARMQA